MSFDPVLLAQSIKVTNWLTPVWLMSMGFALGFVIVLIMMLKIFICQRIPVINSATEKPAIRVVLAVLTAVLYLALFFGFLYWRVGPSLLDQNLTMPFGFAIPICLLLGFGVWSLVSRKMIGETGSLFNEGFTGWLNKVCIVMVIFAVLGIVLGEFNGFGMIKFVDNPRDFINSMGKYPTTGVFSTDGESVSRFNVDPVVIPPSPKLQDGKAYDGDEIAVEFNGQELEWLSVKTDRPLKMASIPISQAPSAAYIFDIPAREDPMVYIQRTDGKGMIPSSAPDGRSIDYDRLYIINPDRDNPANVEITWQVSPMYKEVLIIPLIATFVVGIYLLYFVLATLFPKVFAIAHSTFKTEVGQPLFWLVLIIGSVFIVGSIYVPYNTFGEDIKMYKDSGLTLLRVLAIFLAIWAASKSVAEEIEGRTALTVLSKPVGRRQFILGKFTGISLAIAILFIILGSWFISWTAYKPIYDFQEAAKGLAEWERCFLEAVHVTPGLFLCFLEVVIFVAISVAISTRFGILANFLICFAIYVLGHLTPLLVQSSLGSFEPVVVFGNLVAIVFPVLNHFDVQAAINTNTAVPISYLGWSILYTAMYSAMALLLALVFFEDRDLA